MSEPSPAAAESSVQIEEPRRSIHLGMFGKTPPFTSRQWRVFLIACTAGFFDNYDRALLSLALKQIQKGLKIAEGGLGAMLSLIRFGYILTFFLTPLADVFGRRRLLLYTIFGYTILTGLSALAPNERTFVILQIFARAFAGAEGIVALVILVEEVDAGVRGWTVGLLGALSSVGYGLAAGVFALINVIPYGWRGLYALALIPLVIIIPLRRALPESHRFEDEARSADHGSNPLKPVIALFRAYPGRLVLLMSVAFLGNMGGNAAGMFFPKYLQEAHGYSPANVSTLYVVGGAIGILGNIIAGRMSDRIGRRTMGSICFLAAPLLTIWIYHSSGAGIIPAWILELFFDTASGTIVAAYSAELFPTSHRSTAGSALAVAGTTGGAIGLLLEGVLFSFFHSHWTAISYLTVFWMMAPFIMYFGYPETAGQELEEISPEKSVASGLAAE
ncbi:MAG TPA: MFS transporter [Candidatus Binataceae bacterium]|nr:MFS transporter [Candidatus Binataceae bacterium]